MKGHSDAQPSSILLGLQARKSSCDRKMQLDPGVRIEPLGLAEMVDKRLEPMPRFADCMGRCRRSGDRTSIWYDLEGRGNERELHLLEVAGAEVREQIVRGPAFAPPQAGRAPQGRGGAAFLGRPVERGPFYSRWLAGDDAVVERCEVDRVFDRWHRPLVRMRLHGPSVRESIWAPLFCGPAQGRLARLLRLGGRA